MIKTCRKAKSVRIAEMLKQELIKNPPAAGTRTASATELAACYNVSVPTAHNVLNLLVKDGLLYRKHGSGMNAAYGDGSARKTDKVLGVTPSLNANYLWGLPKDGYTTTYFDTANP